MKEVLFALKPVEAMREESKCGLYEMTRLGCRGTPSWTGARRVGRVGTEREEFVFP